jgi:heterotetrameric sarcosine oxidase gamma subunit
MSIRTGSGCVAETGNPVGAPVARSAILPADPVTTVAGWEVSGRRATSALTIADLTPLAKVLVRAGADGATAGVLGVPHGRAVRDGSGTLVTGSGPGEWLVLAPPGTAGEVIAGLRGAVGDAELVTLLDLTHALAMIRITGERSPDVLAKLCPLDFADRAAPDGSALRSSVAGLAAGVVRDDRPPADRSYLLHCDRSYGQYLFGALLDAGREFAIEVDGFRLPGI